MDIYYFEIKLLKNHYSLVNTFWSFCGLCPPEKRPYVVINIKINSEFSFNFRINNCTYTKFKKQLRKKRIISAIDRKNFIKFYFDSDYVKIYFQNYDNFYNFIFKNNNVVEDVIQNF